MDDMYKNQIDYAEIPADAVILDVRNGSEHTEVALRRKHYFVELPQFDAIIKGGISSLIGKSGLLYEKTVMSMERQVRIVAGALVLLGSVLAMSINVWFALLPAFVGCGLIYAGISNTCAMASLLGKLPWNK